jgi:glycosyltransferase involved in cell wall biosynthesis
MIKKVLLGDWLLRRILGADRVITVCSPSSAGALAAGFSPMQVAHIPNGVDIGFFKPAPVTENRQTITFAGRLDYMKGVHILLEGFKQLRDEMKNVQLTIIGDGPDREKLQNCAREKGISDAVNFCGEAEEIVPYLQQSAVFVLPSFSEGLSNVLLEAMACGLPVVATRVGGTIDLVQDGFNGILIEPDNAGQLYQAMKKILQDKDLAKALGVQARKTAAEKFSLKSVTEQYVSLYQTLVPARNR